MRLVLALALGLAAAACGHAEPAPTPVAPKAPTQVAAPDKAALSQEEQLAAIQKAMNDLSGPAQQCWAAAATERFDIAGELTLQIDIAAAGAHATIVRDTAHNAKLAACVTQLLSAYRWAPPLDGQAIQLPFKFRAPDGQSTIDRALVPWNGQAGVSVAVLLDEANAGNPAASMIELAIARGAATGLRGAERAELWYFLAAGEVRWPGGGTRAVAAGDMMYVPAGAARDVAAIAGDLHAVIVIVPGGREGAARGGALPTREVATNARAPAPQILPAAAAQTFGPATIFADASTIHATTLAASILRLPAGGKVPEHAHAHETEMLYVLDGGGTMTVNGVALPVTPTSVVQVPMHTRHSFTATSDVRAVQIYTPGGPEQRFKAAKP
jgi:quercetin dioxygenase-like cupin family protein